MNRGSWVAQSVKRPTSAQVTILWSVSSSPALGSGLMAQSLEPASDSVSLSLSAPPRSCSVSLCPKNKINVKKKLKKKIKGIARGGRLQRGSEAAGNPGETPMLTSVGCHSLLDPLFYPSCTLHPRTRPWSVPGLLPLTP